MAERENEIGRCKCPVCNSEKARLRINAKQLAYVVCDACNCQIFARSDRSDEKLRQRHISESAPSAQPAAKPPAVESKPPTVTTQARPQPVPVTAGDDVPTAPQTDTPQKTWGAFPWMK